MVGNPANTNAYIAMKSAPDLPRKNFTAMLRLDHNRAASQIAAKTGNAVADIEKLTVWGNHSPTMYADYRFATIDGKSVKDLINDQVWNADTFLPTVGKRGAAIIEARGLSSAASAANAAIDHMRDWALGTNGKWVTMGIPSDGQYGIPKDVMFGFPVTTENGEYKLVEGLDDRRLQPGAHQQDAEGTAGRASRRRAPALSTASHGMLDWNPALYRRYEDERTRPARELLARVPLTEAARVARPGLRAGQFHRAAGRALPRRRRRRHRQLRSHARRARASACRRRASSSATSPAGSPSCRPISSTPTPRCNGCPTTRRCSRACSPRWRPAACSRSRCPTTATSPRTG